MPQSDTTPVETRGDRLKHALAVRGVEKQMALAFELNVHQSAITRWKENGPISLNSACLLCVALDVSLDWLILGRGSIERHRLDEPGCEMPTLSRRDRARARRAATVLSPTVISAFLSLADAVAEDCRD